MFKKGSFEIGATIYPVAIKVGTSHRSSGALSRQLPRFFSSILCYVGISHQYDPKFGDAFWNSSKYSMVNYLLRMMTSWALVCNVWYLPAMHQKVCLDCAHNMWARVYPERRLILSDFLIKMAGWGKRSAVCQQGEVGHRPPGGTTRSPVVKKKKQTKKHQLSISASSRVWWGLFFSHSVPVCICRDGGLKRAKVKESFKEEQQKRYSSMVVGDDSSGHSDWAAARRLRPPPGSGFVFVVVFVFGEHAHLHVFYQCVLTPWTSVSQVELTFFFLYAVKRGGVSVTQMHQSSSAIMHWLLCCWTHRAAELSGFFGFFFNHCWRY